jgi:hypothetical protein
MWCICIIDLTDASNHRRAWILKAILCLKAYNYIIHHIQINARHYIVVGLWLNGDFTFDGQWMAFTFACSVVKGAMHATLVLPLKCCSWLLYLRN